MKNAKTLDLTKIALMAAVTAIMAQLAIPMPAGVPMTLQTLAVILSGVTLGPKLGSISMLIYLLLGAVGVPVFSGLRGGLSMLVGPTGGFILSFPIMALIIGLGSNLNSKEKYGDFKFWTLIVLGSIINFLIGTIVFCYATGSSFSAGLTACVVPFIPTTIIKTLIGGILGLRIKKAIKNN